MMIVEGLSQLNLAEHIVQKIENEDMFLTTHSYLQKIKRLCPRSTELQSQVSPSCFLDHPLYACVHIH